MRWIPSSFNGVENFIYRDASSYILGLSSSFSRFRLSALRHLSLPLSSSASTFRSLSLGLEKSDRLISTRRLDPSSNLYDLRSGPLMFCRYEDRCSHYCREIR